jgi:NAD(P)-dependent dehydrogenase (short-subunit alcohol dehydrogenase family)
MATDLFSLSGKTALVTGGSQGIGLMISRGLVGAGAKVYVSSRKKDVCERAAAELSEIGSCEALPADVSIASEAKRLADELAEREGRLHVLVNNAAAAWAAPITEYPDAAWDKVLGLNVKGLFNLSVACLALLEAAAVDRDPARIINVGSIEGFRAAPGENYAYSASKAAVHNITVNAIAPGPFATKMMSAVLAEKGDEFRANCPMRRLGEPDDMAGIAIYLASRASSYVTGQIIAVDGGFSTTPW